MTEDAKNLVIAIGLSERKLIAIASILAMDTQVIILDEPTIAQDFKGREKIKTIIRHLQAKGKTVISILHDMDFVAETFERALVFAKGKMLLAGTPREVFEEEDILQKASLATPYITRLGHELGYKEVFLDVDECAMAWKRDFAR